MLIDDWEILVGQRRVNDSLVQAALLEVLNTVAPPTFLKSCRKALRSGDLTADMRDTLLQLILLSVAVDAAAGRVTDR